MLIILGFCSFYLRKELRILFHTLRISLIVSLIKSMIYIYIYLYEPIYFSNDSKNHTSDDMLLRKHIVMLQD